MKYGPDGFPLADQSVKTVTLGLFVRGADGRLQSVTSGPIWESRMASRRVETMLADRVALLAAKGRRSFSV